VRSADASSADDSLASVAQWAIFRFSLDDHG
jgi:hypothetical protein